MIWQGTSSGEFTVRSAYHFEVERQERKKGGSSTMGRNINLWKNLWGLPAPNATKVFLWWACNSILPTKENFKRKGVVTDDLCSIWSIGQETVVHILWECQSARDVWGCCGRGLQKRHSQEDDFLKLVENLTAVLSREDLGLFAVTAKGIWQRRNNYIHGGQNMDRGYTTLYFSHCEFRAFCSFFVELRLLFLIQYV